MNPAPSIVLLEVNIGEPVELMINGTFAIDCGYTEFDFVCLFFNSFKYIYNST